MIDYTGNPEHAVLGSVFADNDRLHDIKTILGATGECFSEPAAATVYESMLKLQSQGKDASDMTILLNDIGAGTNGIDIQYLWSLTACEYTGRGANDYATAVRDAWTKRQLEKVGRELVSTAQSRDHTPDQIIDGLLSTCNGLSERLTGNDPVPIAAGVDEALAYCRSMMDNAGRVTGIPSGIDKVDAITGGWQDGDLIIVAARPAVGKTAFALNAALNAAKESVPVLFFSAEMDRKRITTRLCTSHANAQLSRLREGFLARQTFSSIECAADEIRALPITVDDTPLIKLNEIQAKARRWHRKHGRGLIVIDYLGLVRAESSRYDKRHLEVAAITHGLKALGRDLGCPVMVLAQLNRENERDGAKPRLSNLRESGDIEQDADIVMLLSPACAKDGEKLELTPEQCASLLCCDIAKHRNGETGRQYLVFDKPTQYIGDTPRPQALQAVGVSDYEDDEDDTPF